VPALPTLSPLATENLSSLETSLLTILTEKLCPCLVGTLVDLILGHPLPAQSSGPSKLTFFLRRPSPACSFRSFGSTWPSRLAFAYAISAISWLMRTAIASMPCAFFQS
jgi:hypothetical protein